MQRLSMIFVVGSMIISFNACLYAAGANKYKPQLPKNAGKTSQGKKAQVRVAPSAAQPAKNKAYEELVKQGKVVKIPVAQQGVYDDTCGIHVLKDGDAILRWVKGDIEVKERNQLLSAQPSAAQLQCKVGKGLDIVELYEASKQFGFTSDNFIAINNITSKFDPTALASYSSDEVVKSFLQLVQRIQGGEKSPGVFALIALGDNKHWFGVVVAKRDKAKAKYYVLDSSQRPSKAPDLVPVLIQILETYDFDMMSALMLSVVDGRAKQSAVQVVSPEASELLE